MSRRWNEDASESIRLGAFGKHPAWEDFPDAFRDEDDVLKSLKESLVFGAIPRLLPRDRRESKMAPKRACWEPTGVLPGSDAKEWHFLLQRGRDGVLGVMWPSQDGTGRVQYPMVIAVHARDCDIAWLEQQLLPELRRAAETLRGIKNETAARDWFEATKASIVQSFNRSKIPAPDYALAAAEILASALPPDPVHKLRVFHAISSNCEGFQIRPRSRRGEQEDTPSQRLRLPCPAAGPAACLSGWLALLRSQLDDQAPMFAIRASGAPFCDVIIGDLSPEREDEIRLAEIRLPLSEITSEDNVPYTMESGFEAKVEQAIASLSLPWKDNSKKTIFGPVPRNYEPTLPGSGRKPRMPGLGALPRGLSLFKGRRGIWLGAGAGAFVLALTVALLLPRRPNSGGGGRPHPLDPASNQTRVPNIDYSKANERGNWFTYLNDYDGWLWILSDPKTIGVINSPFLRQKFSELPQGQELNPHTVIGSKDDYLRTAVDHERLAKYSSLLRRAYEARDSARKLIVSEYPSEVQRRIEMLKGDGLAGLLIPLKQGASTYINALVKNLAVNTNIPAGAYSPKPAASNALAHLAAVERLSTDLHEAAGRSRADEKDYESKSSTLASLVQKERQAVSAQGDPQQALAQMDELDRLRQWMAANWSQVESNLLEQAMSTAPVASISDWTNMAGQYLRPSDDPRSGLSTLMVFNLLEEEITEFGLLVSGSAQRTMLEDLRSERSRLVQDLQELNQMPLVRHSQPEIVSKCAALLARYQKLTNKIKSLWQLQRAETVVDVEQQKLIGDDEANAAWRHYLVQARPRFKESEAWSVLENCEAVRKVLRNLSDQAGFAAKPPEPDATGAWHAVRADYLEALLDDLVDPSTFKLNSTAGDLTKPEFKQKIDDSYSRWWSAFKVLHGLIIGHPSAQLPSSADLKAQADIINHLELTMALTNADVRRVCDVKQVLLLSPPSDEFIHAKLKDDSSLGPVLARIWLRRQQDAAGTNSITLISVSTWVGSLTKMGVNEKAFPPGLKVDEALLTIRSNLMSDGSNEAVTPELNKVLNDHESAKLLSASSLKTLEEIKKAMDESKPSASKLPPCSHGATCTLAGPGSVTLAWPDQNLGGGVSLRFRAVAVQPNQYSFVSDLPLSSRYLSALSKIVALKKDLLSINLSDECVFFVFTNGFPSAVDEKLQSEMGEHKFSSLFQQPAFLAHNVIPVTAEEGNFSFLEVHGNFSENMGGVSNPAAEAANFISPHWAADIAGSLGCRTPTIGEWNAMRSALKQPLPAIGPDWKDPARQALLAMMAKKLDMKDQDLRTNIFYPSTPSDLVQNYLILQKDGQSYIAGDLTNPTADPAPVPSRLVDRGYANVYLRLAFSPEKNQWPLAKARDLAGRLQPIPIP